MNFEQYKPTTEEVGRAEKMIGSAEAALSQEREGRLKYAESIRANGFLELKKTPEEDLSPGELSKLEEERKKYGGERFIQTLEGVVNGKKIFLRRLASVVVFKYPDRVERIVRPAKEESEDNFSGRINVDGNPTELSKREAKRMFEKLSLAAVDVERETNLIKRAGEERTNAGERFSKQQEEAARKEILSDLL